MANDSRQRTHVVVVGNGMVGHRFVEELLALDPGADLHITILGEETRSAYDRVALSSVFDGRTPEDLSLVGDGFYESNGVALHLGDAVAAIDRGNRTVRTASGAVFPYDRLVLATGSAPFVPPMEGSDGPRRFVYRTLDDLAAIAEAAADEEVRRGVVIGGGLLGLEAANALRNLGLDTHVVEFAPRLMPVQLDDAGGRALRAHIERLGVSVHTGRRTLGIEGDERGPTSLVFDGHEPLEADMVVFSAGIRPRDQLARDCGLKVGERGGIAVDEHLRTSDSAIFAIGECALVGGRIYGLVAPGYRMAAVAAAHLAADVAGDAPPDDSFAGADMSTKLKLLGVDVASVGDVHAGVGEGATGSHDSLVWNDPVAGVYQRIDVDGQGRIVAAVLVGDASPYSSIVSGFRGGAPVEDPGHLLRPTVPSDNGDVGTAREMLVCSCENVTAGEILDAVDAGCSSVAELKSCTRAGTGCGGCLPDVERLLKVGLADRGEQVSATLCSHFSHSRAELFEIIRIEGHTTFASLLERHGLGGAGCEICKPAVASILASLGGGHILDGEQAALQDTNDHFLANLQRDGSYSVVPRIPGGEITPEKLIVIGEVARDFGLYTKITGGQRIDLLGARVEELPLIWRRLVDAGFESGHAYGKSLRTVKSCVGEAWCRYGVADSTSLAILLEERYRGLRAPHKIKMAVSGCARECAEAQSKDVGVIATERGWNLWVGGNGGMRPRHAELLASDLDSETLVRYVDRFLMYYVRTADRLQRTSSWIESLDGGIDHVRQVVVDDSLGVAASMEEMMAAHVAAYECEWKATIDDPERLRRFVTFVNAPEEPDPTIVFVRERGQIRPARPDERTLELAATGGDR